MLKMIVIPIIFFSLVYGAASLPTKTFGKMGIGVCAWYFFTSLYAAVFGSVIIGLIILIFANRKTHTNPYIVVLQCSGYEAEQGAVAYLKEHTQRCVTKSKTAQKGLVEVNLDVRLKEDNTDFINELSDFPGVQSVVLVSYNGEYMG
jgi:hypothetical protein